MRQLTPGCARGVLWSGPIRYQHDRVAMDAGRASMVGPVPRVAGTPSVPFLWRTDHVDVPTLLALRLQGLCGVILTNPDAAGRHAVSLALGLGVPMATGRELHDLPDGAAASISGLGHWRFWETPIPPGAIRVRPVATWSRGDEVELVGGQTEELALIAALTPRAPAIGLLRLEHLLVLDPEQNIADLTGALTRIMSACCHAPVAVRLAQWSADKPAPQELVLREAKAQLQAIQAAADATQHPDIQVVCGATDPKPARLPWGLLVEAPEDPIPSDRDVWVGLGDLSTHAPSQQAFQGMLQAICRRASGGIRLCGIPGPWAQR